MQVRSGWFECASALPAGGVAPARVAGHDLVVWRTEAGEPNVHDAHCPHLGAHLGFGGSVDDATLRCPFHGWRFDTSSGCVSVPYSTQPVPNVTDRARPTAARADVVFGWIGDTPPFDLPLFPWFERGDTLAPDPLYFGIITAVVDDFIENAADTVHFETVHGTADTPVLESFSFDGPIASVRTTQQYATPRGAVAGRIDIDVVGPGLTYTEYSGLFDGAALATFTPVDATQVEFTVRFRFAPETDRSLMEAFVEGSRRQINRDVALWSHRVHHDAPVLVAQDGPILALREWVAQFR